MTWTVSDPDNAVASWVQREAPSSALVSFVLREWLPAVVEHGPFGPARIVGGCVFQDGPHLVLGADHLGIPGLLMELFVDEVHEAALLLSLSKGFPEPG